jgi:hypothetical protein
MLAKVNFCEATPSQEADEAIVAQLLAYTVCHL